jgi:cobalamin synthase
MLRLVALVRTVVSKERIASIMRVTRIGEVGTLAVIINRSMLLVSIASYTNVVPSSPILVTLMMEAISSSEHLILHGAHSVTSQKTAPIVTAVKPSNIT